MEESLISQDWGETCEEILRINFPLHHACRDGDVERLSLLLIEAQKSVYDEDSFYAWTPMHWAAYFGKLGCLRKLMTVSRLCVDCNVRTTRFQQTPSHLAAFGNQPDCLKWLIDSRADVNAKDYLGETPVHKAARSGSMECCMLLVASGCRVHIKNNAGQHPAEVAHALGRNKCGSYLYQVFYEQEANLAQGIFASQPHHAPAFSPAINDITMMRGGGAGCLVNGFHHNGHHGMEDGSGDASVNGFHGNRFSMFNGGGDGLPCHGISHHRAFQGRGDAGDSMEMDDGGDHRARNGFPQQNNHKVLDVTTSGDIMANQRSVGGRKRAREDDDDVVATKKLRNEVAPATGWLSDFTTDCIARESDDQMAGDYGYDYNGFPQDMAATGTVELQRQAASKCHGLCGHFM